MFDFTAAQITEILGRHDAELIKKTEADRLRVLNNPNLEKFRADLDKCLEHYLAKPLYSIPFSYFRRFEDDGDRAQFEYDDKGYFARRGHLECEIIGAWLYPEREDILAALQDAIWAVCDEYTWSVAAHMHGKEALRANLQEDGYTIDLFAAETGDTLAEALILLGDRLDPIVIKRVKRELKKRIIDRFEEGTFGWCENTTNNWAAVCAGSVGMACICELEDNERLGKIIEHLLKAMRNFMSGFAEDGSCLEGTGYWSYGFGYFSSFADMLYKRTGGEIDLFDDPVVHNVALFPQRCCFYGSRGVSFSDSGNRVSLNIGLTHMLSTHYDDIFFPENVNVGCGIGIGGCHRFSLAFNNAVWAPEDKVVQKPAAEYTLLPAAQWYIASGRDNIGIAAKGGNNAEPHNHNDIGNFIVYKNGAEIIADLGSGEYNKEYFRGNRYGFTHCGSQGHCVPVIGDLYQKAGADACARDFEMDESGVKMDIASAYGLGEGNSVVREIRFDRAEGVITVSDNFKLAEAPNRLIERFISRNQPKLTDSGVVIGTEKDFMTLNIKVGKADVKIYGGTEKDHSGKPFTVWYVDYVSVAPGADMEFVFELK